MYCPEAAPGKKYTTKPPYCKPLAKHRPIHDIHDSKLEMFERKLHRWAYITTERDMTCVVQQIPFPSFAVTAVDCKDPLCRIDAIPRHQGGVHGCGRGETIISRRATLLGRRPSLVLSGTDNLSGSTLQSSHMRTVKVVIIGNSGVGKTSLRGQVRTVTWLFIRISR